MKLIATFFTAIALTGSASAALIIGNLAALNSTDTVTTTGINYNPGDPAATPPVGSNYGSKAVGFTMGSTSYTVDSLTLRLTGVSNTGTDAPTIRIYAANAGGTAPSSTLIGTFANPTFTSNASTAYTFVPLSLMTLAANTTYFITVQQLITTGPDYGFIWDNGGGIANTATIPVGPGATNGVATFGSGATPAPTTISSPSGRFNWYELNGTAIPEPSAAALLGLGLVSLAARRRR